MAKADKATAVADIAEQFKDSTATLVTEYRGLTVANLKDLRRSLGASATYTVAKNTLVKRAAAEAGIDADVFGFAVRQPGLYGFVAVLTAMVAGWLASLPFRSA